MKRRTMLAGTLAAPTLARTVLAQDTWPSRPIRIIAPDAPGSGNDLTARIIAAPLEAALGKPVVIDNRPGAGGRIGVEAAFRATPDGYTFLIGNAGSNGINAAIFKDLPYDLVTDFEPISLLVLGPNVLVVNPKVVPARDVTALIAYMKARPGQVNVAITAPGASGHMNASLFRLMTGVEFVMVPYRGAPQMAQAVVSGEAPVNFNNLVNIMPQIQSGEALVLAVTTRERSDLLPGVPTMIEQGLAGFDTAAWNGLLAPKGVAPSIRARLAAEVAKLRDDVGLREKLRNLGGTPVMSAPEAFGQRIRDDVARWKDVVARADIRLE